MTRFDIEFNLRFASRLMERQARLWRRADTALRMLSMLAGSSAVAGLISQQPTLSLLATLFFAVLQTVEWSVQPGLRAAEAWASRRLYTAVMSKADLSDPDLQREWMAAVTADEVTGFDAIKIIAYNDVAIEKGCDPQYAYPLTAWQRTVAFLA